MEQEASGEVNFSEYAHFFEHMLERCGTLHNQIGVTINILGSDIITGDAATMQLIEFVPAIAEQKIPVINEETSKRVVAISPIAFRSSRFLQENVLVDAYNPRTHLKEHLQEMVTKINMLYSLQTEALRVLFMNRFRVINAQANKEEKISANHTMLLALQTTELAEPLLHKISKLYEDLKFLSS